MLPEWMWFVIGMAFGSFANVCIHRLPKGESIRKPRSYCPLCLTQIKWYDNIPVVSYLLLRGRCRKCRGRISVLYPSAELLTGSLFLLQAIVLQKTPELMFAGFYLSVVLVIISFIDLHHKIIPDVLSIPTLIAGFIFSPINSRLGDIWYRQLLGASTGILLGGSILVICGLVGRKIWHKEAIGGGDIKLLAAMGAFLGWKGALTTLVLASVAGTVTGVTLILLGKLNRKDYIPFGPFIAMGAIISWTFQNQINTWINF